MALNIRGAVRGLGKAAVSIGETMMSETLRKQAAEASLARQMSLADYTIGKKREDLGSGNRDPKTGKEISNADMTTRAEGTYVPGVQWEEQQRNIKSKEALSLVGDTAKKKLEVEEETLRSQVATAFPKLAKDAGLEQTEENLRVLQDAIVAEKAAGGFTKPLPITERVKLLMSDKKTWNDNIELQDTWKVKAKELYGKDLKASDLATKAENLFLVSSQRQQVGLLRPQTPGIATTQQAAAKAKTLQLMQSNPEEAERLMRAAGATTEQVNEARTEAGLELLPEIAPILPTEGLGPITGPQKSLLGPEIRSPIEDIRFQRTGKKPIGLLKSHSTKRKVKGKESVQNVVQQVEDVLGSTEGFLTRVAKSESNYGRTKIKNSQGIFQVSPKGLKSTQNIKAHPNLKNIHRIVKDSFGIDWMQIKQKDMKDPLINTIAARIFLLNVPEGIPTDLKEQAKYWKRNYNTKAGAGSINKFFKDNK
jgi:hypothetical protein